MKKSGSELKEKGIKQALDHANKVSNLWADEAFNVLKKYLLRRKKPFMCEDVRQFAEEKTDLDLPPSNRAWGGVIQRAKHKGLIKHFGYFQVSNPKAHKANASIWVSNQC